MSKIGISIFEMVMRNMGVNINSTFFSESLLNQLDNANMKNLHPFIQEFRNIWADNGDILSKHYAGTGSTISNITRVGKGTFFGMFDHGMKSIERFYVGNFEDHIKQQCINLILGQNLKSLNCKSF